MLFTNPRPHPIHWIRGAIVTIYNRGTVFGWNSPSCSKRSNIEYAIRSRVY